MTKRLKAIGFGLAVALVGPFLGLAILLVGVLFAVISAFSPVLFECIEEMCEPSSTTTGRLATKDFPWP